VAQRVQLARAVLAGFARAPLQFAEAVTISAAANSRLWPCDARDWATLDPELTRDAMHHEEHLRRDKIAKVCEKPVDVSTN
jgi:hypothetical protein